MSIHCYSINGCTDFRFINTVFFVGQTMMKVKKDIDDVLNKSTKLTVDRLIRTKLGFFNLTIRLLQTEIL